MLLIFLVDFRNKYLQAFHFFALKLTTQNVWSIFEKYKRVVIGKVNLFPEGGYTGDYL